MHVMTWAPSGIHRNAWVLPLPIPDTHVLVLWDADVGVFTAQVMSAGRLLETLIPSTLSFAEATAAAEAEWLRCGGDRGEA